MTLPFAHTHLLAAWWLLEDELVRRSNFLNGEKNSATCSFGSCVLIIYSYDKVQSIMPIPTLLLARIL